MLLREPQSSGLLGSAHILPPNQSSVQQRKLSKSLLQVQGESKNAQLNLQTTKLKLHVFVFRRGFKPDHLHLMVCFMTS